MPREIARLPGNCECPNHPSCQNISQRFTDPERVPCDEAAKSYSVFYKNGHSYRKDYGLEAETLGADIIAWWDEIKASNLYFGGPTGTCGLIVLMTW